MCKFTFFLLLLLGVQQVVFCQNIDKQILQLLYNDIKQQSEYNLIKKKLKGISLVIDPISGKEEIKYLPDVDKETKDDFTKFSREEQIKILSCNVFPVLLRDTLIIVDALKFFSEENVALNQKQAFLSIIRKYPKQMCVNCMYLYAVGIRENNLILTLTNKQHNKYLYNYYFDFSGSHIKLRKTSIIDKKPSLE